MKNFFYFINQQIQNYKPSILLGHHSKNLPVALKEMRHSSQTYFWKSTHQQWTSTFEHPYPIWNQNQCILVNLGHNLNKLENSLLFSLSRLSITTLKDIGSSLFVSETMTFALVRYRTGNLIFLPLHPGTMTFWLGTVVSPSTLNSTTLFGCKLKRMLTFSRVQSYFEVYNLSYSCFQEKWHVSTRVPSFL